MRARQARGEPARPSITEAQYLAPPPIPVQLLSEVDRGRLALRDVQRKLSKHDAPLKLTTLPGVQGLSHATRFIDGGREAFIEFVQLAVLNNEPVACRWWAVYAELPPYPRSIISFDDVCAASGVKPADLVPVVVSTAMTLGMDVGNLVAAVMHPKVMAAHAQSAVDVNGDHPEISWRDRLAFLQARGAAPLPRNTTINVHANASANAKAAAAASAEPTVPSFSAEMSSLAAPRTAVQRQLADGGSTEPFDFLREASEPQPITVGGVADDYAQEAP